MTTQEVVTPSELARQIQACSEGKFTGQLDLEIQDTKVQRWSLFFRMGSLIWGTSEVHPLRRLHRQLSQHCVQIPVDANVLASFRESVVAQNLVLPQCWDYYCLAELVRQGKVRQWQVLAVIEGNLIEILFDLHQQWDKFRYRSALKLIYKPIHQETIDSIDPTLVLIRGEHAWQPAKQAWEAWQEAGLLDYSPNLAPAIWNPEELRQHTSPVVYYNLVALIDGHQTLRDLAVKLKQNLLPLTQSIVPYIRKRFIELVEVKDLSYGIKPSIATNPQPASVVPSIRPVQPQPMAPLIACIDDSRIDTEMMSQILTQAGYRFITIQDPVKALPILLEHKPALIFLDLIMPITNGYEICGQIRRTSVFKDTPVIILTSNDGIVDRVRAKMVGSSGFLAKPIESEKVLKVLQRHLVSVNSNH